jgi:hypothetical protein
VAKRCVRFNQNDDEFSISKMKFRQRLFKIIALIILLIVSTHTFSQKKKDNDTIVEIKCDSIYINKNITIKLTSNKSEEKEGFFGELNTLLKIEQKENNIQKVILKDSIFSRYQEIKFEDFNNDNIKDILVQNISDVRSNLTYYLYLFNPKTNSFKKVKGFEEIKNPSYNSKYNIVDNYVVSGQNWTSFYKIKNSEIYDLNIVIYDDQSENSKSYDKKYNNAIKQILKTKK